MAEMVKKECIVRPIRHVDALLLSMRMGASAFNVVFYYTSPHRSSLECEAKYVRMARTKEFSLGDCIAKAELTVSLRGSLGGGGTTKTEMLRVIVCMKQVLDPEAPSSSFQVDVEAKRVIPPKGTPPVLNPFDENALEAALRIKDTQSAEITVVSMGRNLARPVVKKSLAQGADNLILLEDNSFEDLDSYSTACILASAIKKLGRYDLILCGRQAADTDAGQVGSGIAEILGIPSITVARKIEVSNGKIRVERLVSDGYEIVEASMPASVTASNEIGELRSATLKAIIATQKKEATVWNAQELGVEPRQMKRTHMLSLFAPARRESKCQIIEGATPEEAGINLALKLREASILKGKPS